MFKNETGFTLIEIAIVLLIIGISSSIVGLHLYNSLDNIRLKAGAKELSNSLRYARSCAVTEKKIFTFKLSNKDYSIITNTDDLDNHKLDSLKAESKQTILIKKPLLDTFQTVCNKCDTDNTIHFFPMGNSSGGEISIKTLDGSNIQFIISKVTGMARVETHNKI